MSSFEYSKIKPVKGECSVCLEDVDADDVFDGMADCVTCSNGHYIHRRCYM